MTGEAETATRYAVQCATDGKVYLTKDEYNTQIRADDRPWRCPWCGDVARWDDSNYEEHRAVAACDWNREHGRCKEEDRHTSFVAVLGDDTPAAPTTARNICHECPLVGLLA